MDKEPKKLNKHDFDEYKSILASNLCPTLFKIYEVTFDKYTFDQTKDIECQNLIKNKLKTDYIKLSSDKSFENSKFYNENDIIFETKEGKKIIVTLKKKNFYATRYSRFTSWF